MTTEKKHHTSWRPQSINNVSRTQLNPQCIWLTGLSASGKTTIASLLKQQLDNTGLHTYLLDGDEVRTGLCRDLGFSVADRIENLRRVSEVARLMVNARVTVLVSFISPFAAQRLAARNMFADGQFIEVFVDASLASCEGRDPKGLYARARRGEIPYFTGIDSSYEPPEHPEIHLHTDQGLTAAECVDQILRYLQNTPNQLDLTDMVSRKPLGRSA